MPLLLLREPLSPKLPATQAVGPEKGRNRASGQFLGGPRLHSSFKCASHCLSEPTRPGHIFRNNGQSSSLRGVAGRGAGAGACTQYPGTLRRREESSLCHQRGAPGGGSLAYGVSNFLVTSGGVLAASRAGAEKAPAPNHSPLPAASGRIILLYADELITVSSIWLLYIKKKCQLLTLCQQPPEGLPLYNASVLLFKDKLLAEHQSCLQSLITALPMGPNEPVTPPKRVLLGDDL